MINVPQENPNIPDNLQKLIEKTRNNISLQEAEVSRLKGLVGSLNSEVGSLYKAKRAFEDDIANLTKIKEDLAVSTSEIVNDVLTKKQELKEMEEEKIRFNTEKQKFDDDKKELVKDYNKQKEELDIREVELNKLAEELAVKQKEVELKISKLAELATIL